MAERQLATPGQIREEQRRMRYLRTLVDLASHVIMQTNLSRSEAQKLVEATRRQILHLFPGKEGTYDLIYRPRFERLIRDYTPPQAKVLPFSRTQT